MRPILNRFLLFRRLDERNVPKSLSCSSSSKMSTDYRFFHVLNTVRSLQNPTDQVPTGKRNSIRKRLRKIDYWLVSSRRLYFRGGIAAPDRTQSQAKRDMPVSSFLLGLVFVGVALAAYADRPLHVTQFPHLNGAERAAASTALDTEAARNPGAHEQLPSFGSYQ